MPVFTFEKISPPESGGPQHVSPPATEKPRGVIVQMFDRFVEARVRRAAAEKPADRGEKPSE